MGLSWLRPLNPNGEINGYRVYFVRGNITGARTVHGQQMHMKFNLTDIGEYRAAPT